MHNRQPTPAPVIDRDATLTRHTRHYYHLAMLSALFAVICIPTAGKAITLFGSANSVAVLFFPFVYIISDLLTEVYGYALARRALWYSIAAQLITTLIFEIAAYAPPAAIFTDNAAYFTVLSQAPILVTIGTLATFIGDIVNNYIVARMKIMTGGKYMATRFVASTLGSQLVNTAIFYVFALGLRGIIPMESIISSILTATILKTAVECLLLPLSLPLARKLKRIEGIDFYDRGTDFNPLKF